MVISTGVAPEVDGEYGEAKRLWRKVQALWRIYVDILSGGYETGMVVSHISGTQVKGLFDVAVGKNRVWTGCGDLERQRRRKPLVPGHDGRQVWAVSLTSGLSHPETDPIITFPKKLGNCVQVLLNKVCCHNECQHGISKNEKYDSCKIQNEHVRIFFSPPMRKPVRW